MSWKRVCRRADVAQNTLGKFSIDGIEIVVANYGDGIRVLPSICPHMEEPLAESGVIARCVLTCTKHFWAWNLETLEMIGETEKPLKTYEVKEEGGDIFVLLDHELVYEFADDDDDFGDDFFSKT